MCCGTHVQNLSQIQVNLFTYPKVLLRNSQKNTCVSKKLVASKSSKFNIISSCSSCVTVVASILNFWSTKWTSCNNKEIMVKHVKDAKISENLRNKFFSKQDMY